MTSGQNAFPFGEGDILEGRYRLNELLGEGGFGAVYKATQLNIDREVAIKLVLPQLVAMENGLERFEREAKVAKRLEHPNTVRMYDYGHTPDGVPYIAWELLRGKELGEALKTEGPMSPERVVRIISQSLKALMEAHSMGIVHRDIKPANIFLSTFSGEEDYVKVLDFGIAKALDATEDAGGKNLTMAGQIIGTPAYMSPEQVKGENVGPPSDLYSLGLLMVEMLTGSVLYGGTGLAICAAHLSPNPTPLPPEVQMSPLGPIIARATDKNPDTRYGSAEEMLNDLKQVGKNMGNNPALTPPALHQGAWGSGVWGSGQNTPAPITGGAGPSQITPQPIVTGVTGQSMVSQQPKSTNYLLIVLGVLGTLVIVALLVIGGLALVMNNDNNSSSGSRRNVATNNNPNPNPNPYGTYGNPGNPNTGNASTSPPIHGNLNSLDANLLTVRLREQGYSLLQQPQVQNSGVVNTTVVSALRGSSAASIMLYDYQFPMGLEAMEASLRQQNQGAVFSNGTRLLYIVVSGQGGGQMASQELAQHLLR